MDMTADGAAVNPPRARATPRVAGRLLRRVRDFAAVAKSSPVNAKVADAALTRLEVDTYGLDAMDRRYLLCIAEKYAGGPVGVETLAAALSEQRDAIEEVIEPYLLQQGFVMRTSRGRVLADLTYKHLELAAPARSAAQLDLLVEDDDE
jgi:Holliday junction DNA helicase RuvB